MSWLRASLLFHLVVFPVACVGAALGMLYLAARVYTQFEYRDYYVAAVVNELPSLSRHAGHVTYLVGNSTHDAALHHVHALSTITNITSRYIELDQKALLLSSASVFFMGFVYVLLLWVLVDSVRTYAVYIIKLWIEDDARAQYIRAHGTVSEGASLGDVHVTPDPTQPVSASTLTTPVTYLTSLSHLSTSHTNGHSANSVNSLLDATKPSIAAAPRTGFASQRLNAADSPIRHRLRRPDTPMPPQVAAENGQMVDITGDSTVQQQYDFIPNGL